MNAFSCRVKRTDGGLVAAASKGLVVAIGLLISRVGGAQEEVTITDEQPGLIQRMGDVHEAAAGCGPVWYASVDALMLWQGNISGVPIFTTEDGTTVVDANDAEPAMAAGPRYGIMRRVGECHFLEGNYFNVPTFEGSDGLPRSGSPFVINPNLGQLLQYGDIVSGQLLTASQIQSAELNWRTWNGHAINWIAGFRWMEWNQQSTINYEFDTPETPRAGTVTIGNDVGNNLYGGQLGADVWLWNNGGPWRVNAIGKAGIFFNSSAYQRSTASLTDAEGTLNLGTTGAQADQTSFVGELGFNASYSLTHWLAIRAGYTLFWLSGVATAPGNLLEANIPEDTSLVNSEGSVFLHGVTAGLEARW